MPAARLHILERLLDGFITKPEPGVLVVACSDLEVFYLINVLTSIDERSCADRFWIVGDDAARYDGERVIFGYVVEGLDAVRSICEEAMSAQEEQAGRGKPAATIRVTSVQVLP